MLVLRTGKENEWCRVHGVKKGEVHLFMIDYDGDYELVGGAYQTYSGLRPHRWRKLC